MLKNYLKVAFRNIVRNKLYATLNILGLSVGLASFFVIYLFLQNELSYDKFHPDYKNVFRLVENRTLDFGIERSGGVSAAIAPAAKAQIPEIEAFSRAEIWPKSLIIPGMKDSLQYAKSISADKGLLAFYGFNFVKGSAETGFQAINSILISETKAQLYFGNENAMGKPIIVAGKTYIVDGVFKDLPTANSLPADIILPFETINAPRSHSFTSWGASYFDLSFFLLTKNADPAAVEAKINELYEENMPGTDKSFSLEPMGEMHFSIDMNDSIQAKTDKQYIFMFTLVAIFILICSVFNYVSLALSQSIERTKEVGVRKVVGASTSALYRQFITESILHLMLSFALAMILVEATTPLLETLVDRELNFTVLSGPFIVIKGLLFTMAVAILSAIYPAYLSTNVKVVKMFKGANSKMSSKRLIDAVSVFQVVVFVALISAAFAANRQMKFMQNDDLGFDKDLQLIIPASEINIEGKSEFLKNELLKNSSVTGVSYATAVPGRTFGVSTFGDYKFRWYDFHVDHDYMDVMGMKIKEGRNFLPEDADSSNLILINETAAEKLNFEGTAVGKILKKGNNDLRIVGVVNDFHFTSKKLQVEATIFKQEKSAFKYGVIIVKLNSNNLLEATDEVNATFQNVVGGKEPYHFFLEDQINSQYKQERVMITLINVFTAIAALVAFIGLFGISGYSAKRRLKEMGIRKVLGASFVAIQTSLNRSNLGRLTLAILISVPLVVYWMEIWLNSFAYRIDMPYGLIMVAVLLASFIMLSTVSFHSIKTFFVNPVDVLKDE